MKQAIAEQSDSMVQSMRNIREEVSNEIKDMTFTEQRAYMDMLLSNGSNNQPTPKSSKKKISSAI